MSAVQKELVVHQQPSPPKDEEPLEDIALVFSQMMYQRKHPRQDTKSPGLPPKAVGHVQADGGGIADTPGVLGADASERRARRVSELCLLCDPDVLVCV